MSWNLSPLVLTGSIISMSSTSAICLRNSFQLEDLFPDRELALSQRAICSMLIEGFLERGGWRQPMASSMPSRISSTSLLSHKQDL
ncbi:unnamed protein product, partial [Vitis vinifera]|uniref:Uncharacterized protein n=1 Tax=Vitis vinifera TaxID=29760 RepID=D7T716_VITVI